MGGGALGVRQHALAVGHVRDGEDHGGPREGARGGREGLPEGHRVLVVAGNARVCPRRALGHGASRVIWRCFLLPLPPFSSAMFVAWHKTLRHRPPSRPSTALPPRLL